MRFSWNINGLNVENWQQLLDWGKRVKPVWTLIMDSQSKAREWKNAVGGEVTYRVWDRLDGEYHLEVTALAAAEQMARENEAVKDMWQYYRLNEAGGEWSHLQKWIIDFAKAAKARGYKSTTHGLAIMKNWAQPEWVEAGNCDALIRYAYENQDTFIINVHEYVTGFAWSAHTPNYPANLFDRALSLQGEKAVMNWTEYHPANGMVNWFLGRIAWVTNIRAKKVVGDVLPFVIDEALFDWHSAVHQQIVTLPDGRKVEMGEELRNRYGDNRYNRDIRGVLGSRRLFEWLETGDTNIAPDDNRFSGVIMKNFEWVERNYPPNCKSIQLFTMNGDWRYPQGHDYIPIANTLLPKMERLVSKPPEKPMLTKYVRALNNQLRIREKPTTQNSVTIGWISTEFTQMQISGASALDAPIAVADGYKWYAVNNGGVSGYSALFTADNVPLVEIRDNVPSAQTVTISKTDFDTLKSILDKYS